MSGRPSPANTLNTMGPVDSNMVHLNPLNPNSDGCPILARFIDLCKNGLSLDENTTKEALNAFKESKHLLSNFSTFGSEQEVESCWFAFILYSVKKLSECDADNVKQASSENGITLSQLLRVTKLNIVVFLKELPQLTVKFGTILSNLYGSDWEKRLEAKELQTNFVQLCVLSKHYKDAFQEFFLTNDANDGSTGYISEYHRFGWLLFLALRIHAFSRFKDLVTCINGLVSVLAILIIHVPIRFRNFTIDDPQCFVRKGNKGVDLVASLCKKYNTSEDELMKTMEKVNNLIVNILEKTPRVASECKTGNLDNIDPDGLIYFVDLLEESSLLSNINILEKNCDESFNNMGDLDERIFAYESSLIGSGSLSGGFKRKFDSITSPTKTITSPLSPQANDNPGSTNPKMIPTPVSTAMTTAKWLRTVISSLPSNPSPVLEKLLSSCDRDLNSDVTHTAHVVLEAIFPCDTLQNANRIDNVWAEQRRTEALKLYYRVLESMCSAESRTLPEKNLTPLLTNERFHRCMLACSAELVLATHKAVTMLFPAVLERTDVTAFDFSKVIESFIRHEESLPRELRRHLNSLEERLLESMVWEKGSSMYNSLIVARPALSTEINRLGLLADPMLPLDAIAVPNRTASPGGELSTPKKVYSNNRNAYTSPAKDLSFNNPKPKSLPLQSAFATPTRPNPDGRGGTCAETEISIFFSKIVKLAAVRINGMVERLQSSQQTRDYVYSLVRQILSQRTSLFFNRHIDQIILCCFYGVAKISQSSLTFKEIIFNYRKQPHCKPHVFRDVFVDWSCAPRNEKSGKVSVDIITFYNDIFIPAVKPLLVELGPSSSSTQKSLGREFHTNTNGHSSESPKVSKFPSLPDMSPKKVSAVHNVYVSPLRSSKRDALITQTSKSYYACVGESTHAYESPSKDLTSINKQLSNKQPNGARKVRGLLNFDEDGVVSDSYVVNKSVCAQNAAASEI